LGQALAVSAAFAQGQVDGKSFDKGAASLRGVHQTALVQVGQRSADGVTVNAKLLGQSVFRGQSLSGAVHALANRVGQLLGNARPKAVPLGRCVCALRWRGQRRKQICHESYTWVD
jgi:hypothetical protein